MNLLDDADKNGDTSPFLRLSLHDDLAMKRQIIDVCIICFLLSKKCKWSRSSP